MAKKRNGTCIYCNGPAQNIREGEHVLPKAMGGALTIVEKSERLVCHHCNNGPLSVVDNELCGRSYLSLISSQEIDASLWQIWDIDQNAGAELVEARPSWKDGVLDHLVCFPQMHFYPNRTAIRGDAIEGEEFGRENFENVLVKAVIGAFQRWRAGEKRGSLFFEPIESGILEQGYKLTPRVYTRHTIREIARNIDKQSFVVRYRSPDEKRMVLRCLSELEPRRTMNRWGNMAGSRYSAVASIFDLGVALRGLMKIGVNILAAFCVRTAVSFNTFNGVMKLIRNRNHPTTALLSKNGFVNAEKYFGEINAANRAHAFRLVHIDGIWHVFSSFFGGRIGAFVAFPGPNHEDWNTLDVVAPLCSKEWQVTKYGLMLPMSFEMGWRNLQEFAPTVPLLNAYAELSTETIQLPRQKKREN